MAPKLTLPTSEHYNMLKPREIREKLRGKVDPELGAILVRMCEDIRETRMQVVAVAKTIDASLDVINSMMHISDALKLQYERRFGPLTPPNTGSVESADSRITSIGGGQKDGGQ